MARRPAPPSAEALEALCGADFGTPAPSELRTPAPIDDLEAKNTYDLALRDWLRRRAYREAGWVHDQAWRLTGPAERPLGGATYGVHPGVRIWYSPEVARWLCAGRPGALPDGAMIVKEMVGLAALAPLYEVRDGVWSPREGAAWSTVEPGSWTVMVRAAEGAHDGWYWANPTAADGDTPTSKGNPPISGRSATAGDPAGPDAAPPPPRQPQWYPTGVIFSDDANQPDVVPPYNGFGAYCLNCHASATDGTGTFVALDNVLGPGIQYSVLAVGQRCTEWPASSAKSGTEAPAYGFPAPLDAPDPAFTAWYDQLEPVSLAQAWPHRFPAETWDHVVPRAGEPTPFVTSDQCMGCHDATISNSRTPYMVHPTDDGPLNLSPYGEWRASPMGLAGRDPVFFAQLQSETNHLPEALAACIETTCLHCHGVMGQRQLGLETAGDPTGQECVALFGVEPPPEVAPADDPDYTDPQRTGADEVVYSVALGPEVSRPVTVRATLYSQSIPPAYLQERFASARVGAGAREDLERLYHLTSHLDTTVTTTGGDAFLAQWKVELARGEGEEGAP